MIRGDGAASCYSGQKNSRLRGLSFKRLKGLELSTLCMAIRTGKWFSLFSGAFRLSLSAEVGLSRACLRDGWGDTSLARGSSHEHPSRPSPHRLRPRAARAAPARLGLVRQVPRARPDLAQRRAPGREAARARVAR